MQRKYKTPSFYNLMIKISIELKTANKSCQVIIVLRDITPLGQSETYIKAEPNGAGQITL